MKVLRILLLSIIFNTVAIGQGLMIKDDVASAAAGKTIYKYVSSSNPVPVDGTVTVSGGATGGGYNKVTSTGGDSLAATETSYWRPTIRAVDDTVAFSKSRTYPATDLNILYPGQSYTFTMNMDVATMPKLYFKTFGVGTPTVQLKHEGR